jgi:uncharacterized protein with ParB-like and HNH nuclease domain
MALKIENLASQLDQERRLVSFDIYDMSVKQLLDMVATSSIDIAPDYQRQFVWNEERQSIFIESVFLGIPIPSLFMATNKDATWELVDGVQRLSTIINFCGSADARKQIDSEKHLKLQGLEKLNTFNGFRFEDLPKSLQLTFELRPIRVTTLNDKSDLDVRFDLFERLNTGGVILQPQEIRNCVYRGPFNDLIKEFAGNEDFNHVVRLKSGSQSNGTREEFVLRFFAYLINSDNFDHSVREFLNDFMKEKNKQMPKASELDLFVKTFKYLAQELPEGIARNRSTTPANLYEAIAVGTALAIASKKKLKKNVISKLLTDATLRTYTTGATNSRKMVKNRIEYVLNKLI